MSVELAKHVAIPVGALAFGCSLFASGRFQIASKTLIYFGAQTGMNIYMKSILSHANVSETRRGMPAAFVVTALQQVMAFVMLLLFIAGSRLTEAPLRPKLLTTTREWGCIMILSICFCMNIALNNYSLSLIPISINLIIRSCLPLCTLIVDLLLRRFGTSDMHEGTCEALGRKWRELCLMLAGVSCAMLAILAQDHGHQASHDSANHHFRLGVAVCVVSTLCAAANLALVGLLGSQLQLSPVDTTVYMSLPSFVILLGPIFLLQHPVGWDGVGYVTDFEVLKMVLQDKPGVLCLALFSGVFAATYNVLTYKIVQSLSAAHTAFAGSFNNAATFVISILAGLEVLPDDPLASFVLISAVIGNIASFAGYNLVKVAAHWVPDVAQELADIENGALEESAAQAWKQKAALSKDAYEELADMETEMAESYSLNARWDPKQRDEYADCGTRSATRALLMEESTHVPESRAGAEAAAPGEELGPGSALQ
eukprot:TRINITY_DN5804_c0_g2_i1.p1 TRINITY_DN5804_c0_g2~~TRINITY_DN5804_c0_g2_i1.p1  ORF type:complete len:484 (-),score=69.23 TRINITY_DN5804_c0_g2_i1:494-1945(-)